MNSRMTEKSTLVAKFQEKFSLAVDQALQSVRGKCEP